MKNHQKTFTIVSKLFSINVGRQLLICFLLCLPCWAAAQQYHFPVNPGQKAYLTGSVAEIRTGHFHAGLDIATNTGTKVYAAADGYVRRLKASTWGYGNVLYVMHPSTNEQTVYAHLSEFNEHIGNYVREKQYEQETFEIELLPDPEVLPVKKGEIIGYVGNTGQSGGPHLHYEIRTPDDVALNPMLYGFKEIPTDNAPPLLQKIALEALDPKARVESQFIRQEYALRKTGTGTYIIDKTIPIYGKIGLEVLTHDIITGGYNILGTTEIKILLDGKQVYAHDFNQVSHEYNRCMNLHINYPIFRRTYKGFQRCYLTDGNRFDNYQARRFTFDIQDEDSHEVTLIALDPAKNRSTLTFQIMGKKPSSARFVADKSLIKPSIRHSISENILVIKAQNIKQKGDSLPLSFNGVIEKVPLAYQLGNTCTYLWDLRQGLPDMVETEDVRYPFAFERMIPSGKNVIYEGKDFLLRFPEGALFDTLYLEVSRKGNFFQLNDLDALLFSEIEVFLKDFKPTGKPTEWAAYHNGTSHQRSNATDSTLHFFTRNLGSFYMKRDASPPQITLLSANAQQIQARVSDGLAGIKVHKASLNGKFLLLRYEHKAALLFSEPLKEKKLFQGELQIMVEDKAGNIQILKKML